MIFIAKIDYNFMQSREAKLFGDENIHNTEIEFTFEDLLNDPCFSIRELIIPWLLKGNIPEIREPE